MSHTHARRWMLAAVLAVLALVLAACGSSSNDDNATPSTGSKVHLSGVPGVTDTEIRFASFGTNSNNPLGNCYLVCYDAGIKAYFAFRNSQGGIYGRKLKLTTELDDQVGQNQQRALEIVSANDTFASFSATLIAAGWGDIAKAGIPLFTLNIFPDQGRQPGVFGTRGGLCITCTSRATAYEIKLAKATKVAALAYGVTENSKLCAKSVADSVAKYSRDIGGAKAVYVNDSLEFGLSNGVGPEVTAMKKAGVDLVIGCIDLNGMKTVAAEMERQGMGDVPMVHPNSYDRNFVNKANGIFEGDYVAVPFTPFEAKGGAPALTAFKTWMARTGKPITEHAMDGWINADEAFTALEAAGPTFNRAKVIAAFNKVTRYTAGGLIEPYDVGRQHQPPTEGDPATYGPDPDCVALVKIHNNAFEVVGDPSKPWICWPGTTRAWSEPTRRSFG